MDRFSNKVRFNWGYHDAQDDIKHNRPVRYLPARFNQDRPLPTWDKAYCQGYESAHNS